MPPQTIIPVEVQEEVLKIVEEFNRKTFTGEQHPLVKVLFGAAKRGFAARFKGKFLYLDRTDRRRPSEICRLTWNGKMDNWALPYIVTRVISTIPTSGCLQAQAM